MAAVVEKLSRCKGKKLKKRGKRKRKLLTTMYVGRKMNLKGGMIEMHNIYP